MTQHPGYFDLRNAWAANFYRVAEVKAELEQEYENMKERGLPAPLLEKKNNQIDTLIEFYNLTEQMLKVYDENLKDYRASLRMYHELDMKSVDMCIRQLQYMTKYFKDGNSSEGWSKQPGLKNKADVTK